MMEALKNERHVPCNAIQFSGEELTVWDDLPEIIELAEDLGLTQTQIACNGILLAVLQPTCSLKKGILFRLQTLLMLKG